MNKAELKRKIYSYDFAIHELVLFLDTHPTNKKALMLLEEYRKRRADLVAAYEERFGAFIVKPCDVPVTGCWRWLEGPWKTILWRVNLCGNMKRNYSIR